MPYGVLESFQKKDALVDLVVLQRGPFYAQNLKQKLGWLATGNQRNHLDIHGSTFAKLTVLTSEEEILTA